MLFGRAERALQVQEAQRFNVEIPARWLGLDGYDDPLTLATPITREQAIQVPAVKRARDKTAPVIGRMPLGVFDAEHNQLVSDLLDQPERNRPLINTITDTVEDLLFGDGRSARGIAWWRVIERNWNGYPRFVERIAPHRVTVDSKSGTVWIDGKEQRKVNGAHPDLIRFDSPTDALLVAGARAIRDAVRLGVTASQYADDPQAREWFTLAEGEEERDDEEIIQALDDWKAARKRRAVGYAPPWLEHHDGNLISPKDLQLVDARQQAVLEIARAANIDPEELGVSTTSRTYANMFERRKQFIDDTLGVFISVIEQRLSMGDVTKRGQYVRFNLDDYLRSDTKTRYETYQIGKAGGWLTLDEIRNEEHRPTIPEEIVKTNPTSVAASNGPKFDGEAVSFTGPAIATGFKVNPEQRTVTGLLVPFGVVGNNGMGQWIFSEDSIVPPEDVTRVKLLMDHSFGDAIGYATELKKVTDGDAPGWYGTFKIARGPAGDNALTLAEDKVYDGFSVGLGYGGELSMADDNTYTYTGAPWLETSLTPLPAFSDARVTAVAASAAKEGNTMKCEHCGAVHAPGVKECNAEVLAAFTAAKATDKPGDPAEQPLTAEEFARVRELIKQPDGPQAVSAAGNTDLVVKEGLPYRFDRKGNFQPGGEHDFSGDLLEMARFNDIDGTRTDAGKRVMALIKATFDIDTADINELNPNIQRPDMYVDQRDYKTPLWNFIDKGAPPNGVQPFTFPKFSSAAGLVGDHTEGVEPASGSFVTTNQTVTPTGLSGKASITREVWDMGGNPAVSGLIWRQMLRGWKEGLETAAATFLNTLTAATDITLAAGSADDVLAAAWDAAIADLQFVRGYDFEAFAVEKELYKKFVAARDADGRVLFPIISPVNANGTAQSRFRQLDLSGVVGVPSWALPSTAGSPNNSWLFDPATVHGWATAPTRLEFPGTASDGSYAPVAMVDLGIWGYKAFANSDIGGVRQVIYDTVA